MEVAIQSSERKVIQIKEAGTLDIQIERKCKLTLFLRP